MARPAGKTLTENELQIMDAVWRLQAEASAPAAAGATVQQVVDRLVRSRSVAYNTVQTMMGILVKKGYLDRHKDGRAHVYTPRMTRGGARREALGHVLQTFFGGSRRELLENLLDPTATDAAEIEALRELVHRAAAAQASSDDDETSGSGAGDL
ncbi:MAG: BlaI/MecI/CopY family transcriptional regulator [Acidobacteriota bacterium]